MYDSATTVGARRRISAYLLDAVLVGIPAVIVSVIVPILPIGLIIWTSYRLFAAVSGRSIGRAARRWKLTRADGTPPGARGVIWFSLAAAVPVSGVFACGMTLFLGGPAGWSWLLWAPSAVAVGAIVAVVTATVLWSGLIGGSPRVDRWSKLVAARTGLPVSVEA